MSDIEGLRYTAADTLEVRVTRGGVVVHIERCEDAEQAASVVATWSDVEGATAEVVDLLHSEPVDEIDEILSAADDEFPHAV